MPINNNDYYRIIPIKQTDEAERFHREKTKRLTREYNRDNNSSKTYNGKSFGEILNDEMAKKK